jgi:hypothetical protein
MLLKRFLCIIFLISFSFAKQEGILNHWRDVFYKTQAIFLKEFSNETPFKNFKGTLFYPFGGPDVTYPLILFPGIEHFILVGLEGFEEITPPLPSFSLTAHECVNLTSIYKRSFFVTHVMAQSKINVLKIIIKQLKFIGASDITFVCDKEKNMFTVSFKQEGKEKKISYFQMNVYNGHFSEIDMNKMGHFDGTFMKGASYLPHEKGFSKIHNFILEKSMFIVQDSTGIRLNDLKKNFDVELYGRYKGVYKFPGAYEQKDLISWSLQKSNPELRFSFGYGCGIYPTNILYANKKTCPASEQHITLKKEQKD